MFLYCFLRTCLPLAVIAITSYYYIFDTQLTLVILAFFTVLIGTGITIKYQNCTSNIRKSELSKNKAITLENRVKIKYVNTKNAVDYACEKYHVKNSNDLNNIYEEYMKTVRDKERYKITNGQICMIEWQKKQRKRDLIVLHTYLKQ